MACRLVGAKPLSEPMLEYCKLDRLETNFSEILIAIHTFSFKKMHLKMSSPKRQPFCLGLNVLTHWGQWYIWVSINWAIIVNGLLPMWHQATTSTNDNVLPVGNLRINFSEIWFKVWRFPFKKMHLNMLSPIWRHRMTDILNLMTCRLNGYIGVKVSAYILVAYQEYCVTSRYLGHKCNNTPQLFVSDVKHLSMP